MQESLVVFNRWNNCVWMGGKKKRFRSHKTKPFENQNTITTKLNEPPNRNMSEVNFFQIFTQLGLSIMKMLPNPTGGIIIQYLDRVCFSLFSTFPFFLFFAFLPNPVRLRFTVVPWLFIENTHIGNSAAIWKLDVEHTTHNRFFTVTIIQH